MNEQRQDPLFTTKGILMLALYGCIYAAIVFSMDPEWVGWAGPMALGALYVPNPPPPLFSDPAAAFKMGYWLNVMSLFMLVLVSFVRREDPFGLWSLFKARLKKPA